MRNSLSYVTGAAAFATAALLVTGCSTKSDGHVAAQSAPTVAVAKTVRRDLVKDVVMTAEFKPFQDVDVMAKVSGYVRTIRCDIGDRLRQGELVAVLEVPEMADDLARAKAALKASQAEAARSRDELKRAQSLHEIARLSYQRLSEVAARRPGLVAQQEIDDLKSKDLATDAQVAAARSGLEAAEHQIEVNREALAKVQTMLGYSRVTAPFSGVVTKRYANVGSMIQAGTASQSQAMPLVRLAQDDVLRLIVPVPESAVPKIHIGQQVEVQIPSLKRSVSGKVTRFTTNIATATRTMDTEVDVPNPGLTLIPGMYAEVRLVLDQHQGTLAVPITAVDQGDENSGSAGNAKERAGKLLVVTPANRIEVRRVLLGLETANQVEVTSGLNEGDLVVIGSRSTLQGGQSVQPKITAVGDAPSKNGH